MFSWHQPDRSPEEFVAEQLIAEAPAPLVAIDGELDLVKASVAEVLDRQTSPAGGVYHGHGESSYSLLG